MWLTGVHSVREALRAGRRRIDMLWLREGTLRPDQVEIAELAESAGIAIERVDRTLLQGQVEGETNPQGVGLRVGPLPEMNLATLLGRLVGAAEPSQAKGACRLVALDGVEDPQNVGAVARVAESAGVSGLILTDRRAPALTPTVSRASAGAIEWLPVVRVPNLGRALSEAQESGFWIVAAAPDGDGSLFTTSDRVLTGRLVVVLGAEGKGVRPSIVEQADHRIEIPMRGEVDSLNVATAGAVILYDLLRRSESPGVDPI